MAVPRSSTGTCMPGRPGHARRSRGAFQGRAGPAPRAPAHASRVRRKHPVDRLPNCAVSQQHHVDSHVIHPTSIRAHLRHRGVLVREWAHCSRLVSHPHAARGIPCRTTGRRPRAGRRTPGFPPPATIERRVSDHARNEPHPRRSPHPGRIDHRPLLRRRTGPDRVRHRLLLPHHRALLRRRGRRHLHRRRDRRRALGEPQRNASWTRPRSPTACASPCRTWPRRTPWSSTPTRST